ncbi:hypothetical protein QOT17_019480 [Balamuthia mandrillaris]
MASATFALPARLLTPLNTIILPSKESCLPSSSSSAGSNTISSADASYSTPTTDLLCIFSSNLNSMLVHWALIILHYDFKVFHQPGIHHILEDSLSQLYTPSILSNTLLNVPQVPQNAKTLAPKPKINNIELDDSQLLAPSYTESLFHKVLKEGYFWSNICNDCHNTACHCKECLRFNITRLGFHPLKSIHATFPFKHIAINLTSPLQTDFMGCHNPALGHANSSLSQCLHNTHKGEIRLGWFLGYQYIFIIMDITTRFMILHPLKDSVEEVSHKFVKIICELGFPKIIQSNNSSEFINKVMSTVHDQAADGAAESHIKLTKSMLLKSLKEYPVAQTPKWPLSYPDNYLKSISKLKTPCEIISLTKVMLQITYLSIYEKVANYSTNVEKHFNTNNKIICFSPGDKVMLKNSSANSKTDPKFLGPFIIHHCTDNRAYILQDITGDILPDKVPPSAFKPVDPDTSFKDKHFEVEKVLDMMAHLPTATIL